jgi:hypothetical protein
MCLPENRGHSNSAIDFSLVKMRDLWILAADDIIRYYLAQNLEAFEFILLADQSSNPEDFNAVIQTHEDGLKALYKLMDVQTP